MTGRMTVKMKAEKCFLFGNGSYKAAEKMVPVGIIVHSTGADNPTLKRYVQPSDDDPDRAALLEKLGVNRYGNSWNRASVKKSAHFFIGKLADGSVGTVQTLPTDISCWGCGRGKKGSYNYAPHAHIQFEICEDGLDDREYFTAVYNEAVKLCAELCREYSLSPSSVISHREAAKLGYASNHADIDHWLRKFRLTMADFRRDVAKLTDPYTEYRVVRRDNLSKIARKHKTTVARIVALNSDRYPTLKSNPGLIRVGWVLKLDRV